MKETSYSDRRLWFSYILFIIIIGGILVLFIYIKQILASKEIFSPSNKMHQEVGRATDLSAPLWIPCRGDSLRGTERILRLLWNNKRPPLYLIISQMNPIQKFIFCSFNIRLNINLAIKNVGDLSPMIFIVWQLTAVWYEFRFYMSRLSRSLFGHPSNSSKECKLRSF